MELSPRLSLRRAKTISRANVCQVRRFREVLEGAGFAVKIEDGGETDFRSANRLTRPSGSLRFAASSWSVGSIWDNLGHQFPLSSLPEAVRRSLHTVHGAWAGFRSLRDYRWQAEHGFDSAETSED